MRLRVSNTQLRCTDEGFLLKPPDDAEYQAAFQDVCESYSLVADDDGRYPVEVPRVLVHGRRHDTTDRIQLGAALLRDLIAAGL